MEDNKTQAAASVEDTDGRSAPVSSKTDDTGQSGSEGTEQRREQPEDGGAQQADDGGSTDGATATNNNSGTEHGNQADRILVEGMQEIEISDGSSNGGLKPPPLKATGAPAEASYSAAGSAEQQEKPRSPGRRPLSPNAIGIVRTSSKSPATTHPLQGGTGAGAGDGRGSAVSSPKGRSFESADRTAAAAPMTSIAASSASAVGRAPASRVAGGEISESEEDDDDPVLAYEEEQRRRFRLAEQRRVQKEQLAQRCVSSEDIETMRSGLYNARESRNATELRILNGKYPDGLRGSLFMVGPGSLDISYNVQGELEQSTRAFTFGNLMDALPLVTKISFDPNAGSGSGAIVHRSRLVAGHMASRIQTEHGINARIPGSLYQSESNQTVLTRFMPRQTYPITAESDCCSQSVQLFVPLQGSSQNIVCTNHTGALQNIDPVDLRPRAIVETKQINGAFACSLSCPHMQHDANTREHFMVLQDVGFRSTTYSVVSVSEAHPDGYVVATFTAQPSVLHSFSLTRDYVVVPVYPYQAPVGGPGYRWSDSLLETLEFDRTRPVVFYVISREYRRVHCVYKAPAFFAMHQINAVQEPAADDSVAIDCIAYEDDAVLRRLRIDSLRRASAGFAIPSAQIRRYRLQRITMEAQHYVPGGLRMASVPAAHVLVLRNEPAELPSVSPAFVGKPYTYLYGVSHLDRLLRRGEGLAGTGPGSTMYNCLVKLNVADPAEPPRIWSRNHCLPSEPVFVPRSDAEDDGYVVSVFFDSMRIASCLLVLDAATFEEILIAQLPSPVPVSFGHAKFAI
ncbi:hypothetical protein IWW48_004599 [Coemansia sp. RSA 1200]|nr:hypothetical protein IWW48_004599 [Coemansia sp. RSA 1200]